MRITKRFALFGLGAAALIIGASLGQDRAPAQAQEAAAPAISPAEVTAPLVISVAGEAEGEITIALYDDVAPAHAARLRALAESGAYDGVVFHRVINGFMAQTGDVEFGRIGGDMRMAGRGGSDLPDLPAEFSDRPFVRGVVGMARSQSPDSANSQFFIMFAPARHLDGQYTAVGEVVSGMDVVDAIKRGAGPNGAVTGRPDVMESVRIGE
ncbi:peptidylprolyl isomerase [Poseidonocella sedimentorum]|uniref:Peptidyl-prolyl cis-trans isomerase n=1 Tax=Poseidonocella sedimentorum TaxID=871652 RepID=A0A1I6DGX3_9RHOB|nr:peptidylprolyl isomerase [Poseidonocella sedimentorum]SFR04676.1 peptidylprolyl isomerase [Poseidonocella sedimentorum]